MPEALPWPASFAAQPTNTADSAPSWPSTAAAGSGEWEGKVLGKYRITGKLGEGGMGVVYEAQDSLLERQVAIKLLPESVSRDPIRCAASCSRPKRPPD